MPRNAGSDAKMVCKHVAILYEMVSTISTWFPVHVSVRIDVILPVPNSQWLKTSITYAPNN